MKYIKPIPATEELEKLTPDELVAYYYSRKYDMHKSPKGKRRYLAANVVAIVMLFSSVLYLVTTIRSALHGTLELSFIKIIPLPLMLFAIGACTFRILYHRGIIAIFEENENNFMQ